MEQMTDKVCWPYLHLWGALIVALSFPSSLKYVSSVGCIELRSLQRLNPLSLAILHLLWQQLRWLNLLDSFSEVLSQFFPCHTCRPTAARPSKGQLFKELMGLRGQRWWSCTSAFYLCANMDLPIKPSLLGNSCVLSMKRSREGQEKSFLKLGIVISHESNVVKSLWATGIALPYS